MKIATTTGDFKLYCQNDIERINELNKSGFKGEKNTCTYKQGQHNRTPHKTVDCAVERSNKF